MQTLDKSVQSHIINNDPKYFHCVLQTNNTYILTLFYNYPDIDEVFMFRINTELLKNQDTATKFIDSLFNMDIPVKFVHRIKTDILDAQLYINSL